MLNKINNATTKDELKSLIEVINGDITLYCNSELIKLCEALKRKEILLNLTLQQRIIELQGIAQNWFERKDYDISLVFTELAEDYKKELNIKL